MRNGCHAALSILIVCLALIAAPPAPVSAQEPSEELLDQAVRRTGLSREELMRRYRERVEPGGAEQAVPPGLTELPVGDAPVERPAVILPFDLDLAEAAADTRVDPSPVAVLPDSVFGASFFRLDAGVFAPPGYGPVPESYQLGVGDEVFVDVWGEVEFRLERVVDRDGAIILPKGGKVRCAGRSLDQVAGAVREKLSGSYSGIDPDGEGGTTFVDVSLGRLRAVRVFVVGEAAQPGAYEVSSVATVFTALYAAGGPNAQGSLRDVRLLRGEREVATLDLYDYLLSGKRSGDAPLREGDTVYVPPRGITVHIEGEVRRELTFEMKSDEDVRTLIRYAGGFTAEAETDHVHVARIVPPRERRPEQPDRVYRDLDLRLKMLHPLQDGDVVRVGRIPERLENWVEIRGNVKQPGRYQYREGLGVAELVGTAGGLWSDTLVERAVIERTESDLSRAALDFDLAAAVAGGAPVALQPMDVLRVFSIWDVQDRHEVAISGAVRTPGSFDWRENLSLRDLILKAGGLQESADLLRAEVSRLRRDAVQSRETGAPPQRTVDVITVKMGEDWLSNGGDFVLEPHDRVAIRSLPWWELPRQVTVRGEVHFPGVYTLDRSDERLSSVIARAGGLKHTAYAPGTRVVRAKDGLGNVAMDLASAISKPGSEHDAILEDGDEILVPPVPYTVKVTGAVGFPTSIIYEGGKSVGDYVARAGGYADMADKWKTHVVYPNGMSKQIRKVWGDPEVMPGSTIVVPMKSPDEGPRKLETMKEIASILASVATVWLVIDRTTQ
ncbi:SLBB domain-containing protein [bacterium]|nr:SLBB domain-containing protein [bacterium]